MEHRILSYAAHCYGVTPDQLQPMSGGHFTSAYEFVRDGQDYVLRITPPDSEVNLPAMRAILEWSRYLATHGAPVAAPAPSGSGRLLERAPEGYLLAAFEKARGILAEALPQEQWRAALVRSLGRAVGKVHALAKGYALYTSMAAIRRPHWDEIGNCFNPEMRGGASEALITERRARLVAHLSTLPKTRDSYGLIHADLHFGNFFVDPDENTVTLFDFDDCAYGWYVMDIAMTLFDALVLHEGADKEAFAAWYLQHYLEGYLVETGLDAFWFDQLPHFLKLAEIGVYLKLCEHPDLNQPQTWVGKFMKNRKQRIENDIAYIDFDQPQSGDLTGLVEKRRTWALAQ
jgi:Ser/Thr protein kinase RdoA (MazF antagonist)